ncbi:MULTISPECIES: ABC transporter substrate-binding protein [unclassified Leptolyngbya]|uniref:ABC transporter substrate-binding protein n=1 Tax=unclassified Leptolyngbya TaxID=2650499 RepID=UPI001681DC53|nr:ABC transporter substrate-binding protein [Leptolyngbya sp. FACHB-8]MBD2159001.1 ABC transporter substrate-binding protein [Leptolyngbya sp. FACHB-16]
MLFKKLLRHNSSQWQVHLRSRSLRVWIAALIGCLTCFLVLLPVFSQQPVEIRFLMLAPETPLFAPLIEEFERENPDIRIRMVEGPNATNLVEDLYTSALLLGSSPYDLINLDVVWTAKFAAAGWLMDLSDRATPQELAQHLETSIEAGRYQDKLYRIPWRTDAGVLFYRKDLLQEAGLQQPQTFTDLLEVSKTLQQKTGVDWGYLWQGRQYEGVAAMFVEVLSGFGGYWINPETLEVGLDQPEAINAVNFLRGTVRQGVSPGGVTTYQEEEVRRLFQSGGAAFMRNWPYAIPLLNSEESAVRNKVGIRPMLSMPGGQPGSCLGGWGWGILSSTPHPEEAWRVLQYFTSERVQRINALKGYLPSLRSLYEDPEILAEFPHYAEMAQVFEKTVLRPSIAQYAQASDILQRYLSAVFSGRMAPEDAMQTAASETRSLLGRLSSAQEARG